MQYKIPEKYYEPIDEHLFEEFLSEGSCQISGTSSFVDDYESALCHWFNTKYAVALSSGSAAILLALYALGVNSGEKVVVNALSPIPTLLPLLKIGADVVYVDSKPDSFGFDEESLEKALKESPKCLLSVSVWGYPVIDRNIISLCSKYGVPIIEDAAHAHGTVENSRLSGSIGEIGCFSTHENKVLSTGEGGFIITDNRKHYEFVRSFSRLGGCKGTDPGFNYKMSALQAKVGISRIKRLSMRLSARKKNAYKALEHLQGYKKIKELPYSGSSSPNYYCLGLFLDIPSKDAEECILKSHRLGLTSNSVKYDIKPSYEYPIFGKKECFCPNAKELSRRVTSIPTHPGINNNHLERIFNIISKSWNTAL